MLSTQAATREPVLAWLRDLNPWHPIDNTGFNKVAYISSGALVVYPRFRGINRKTLDCFSPKNYKLFHLELGAYRFNTDKFFSENVGNRYLFNIGINALSGGDLSYFDNPIKLPILSPISDNEFEARWRKMLSIITVGDVIMTFNRSSIISHIIATGDHGTWSHTACYIGNGKICEAITGGVVERPLDAYKNHDYRLGVYRGRGITSASAEAMACFLRSQIGKKYNYEGVLRLGVRKFLGIASKSGKTKDTSPNDLAMRLDLIAIV